MKRPVEADYTSQVAYTRALEAYCDRLEQPWPDRTKQQRESYQKGHNDGVAHHKQALAQKPMAYESRVGHMFGDKR